jgi:hypothetical protein
LATFLAKIPSFFEFGFLLLMILPVLDKRGGIKMFWESVETVKERTLQQMVKEPSTSLDDILNHDYCFQELRVESPYLVE